MRLFSFIKLPTYKRYQYVPRYGDGSEERPVRRFVWTRGQQRLTFKGQGLRWLLFFSMVALSVGYWYWGEGALWGSVGVLAAWLVYRIVYRVVYRIVRRR